MADRLLFSKTDRARFISHLDLMRTFQRAFQRAGIEIKHTEGFHPHPYISIALPLSVGFSSECEILEFELINPAAAESVPAKLNKVLPEGIEILKCYPAQEKIKNLAKIHYFLTFEYPSGRPCGSENEMISMLSSESVLIEKKSKKSKAGTTQVDIIPLIYKWNVDAARESLTIDCVLAAQNPGLNPDLICKAFCQRYPQSAPDFTYFHRRELLTADDEVFL